MTPSRLGAPLLVALGGAVALSWEMLWQVHASLAIGVSAFGTAVTLAATMLGMTLGALVAGRMVRERAPKRPLRVYGWLELGIGAWGAGLPFSFAALETLDTSVWHLAPAAAPFFQGLAIAAVLVPPAFAMGASVPVFAQVTRVRGVSLAVLYGANTAGAALGVVVVSFFAIPAFGLTSTGWWLAGTNVAVFALSRVFPAPMAMRRAEPTAVANETPLALRLALGLVFCTGFATFALEVAWFRSLRAAFQATTESFAIVLVSVLVPLALAAEAVPRLRRAGLGPGGALAFAGPAILLATPLIERMDRLALGSPSYGERLVQWTLQCLLLLGPAVFALGLVLPLCLERFGRPGEVGRLYAANTLGAVLGSLGTAWLLLPAFGFARAAWGIAAFVVIAACVALSARTRVAAGLAGVAALVVAIATTSSVGRDRVQILDVRPGHDYRILGYEEGPDATVSVLEDDRGDRVLVIDGFITSTERRAASYMVWMGRLPMILHPDPERALVICFGTGQTARGALDEEPAHLDVVDVSAAVLRMAPLFESNRNVLDDPRVETAVMDGRAWVRREDRRYDVVTLEPMAPYFAGTNALYSREFYEAVAGSLTEDGVVAQWLPLHLLPPYYAASAAATFQAIFPDAVMWVDPGSGTAILLGRRTAGARPLGEVWPGLSRNVSRRELTDREIRDALRLDAEGVARFARPGTLITDDNQLLAYSLLRGEIDRMGRFGSIRASLDRVRALEKATGRKPPSPPRRHRD